MNIIELQIKIEQNLCQKIHYGKKYVVVEICYLFYGGYKNKLKKYIRNSIKLSF
jgi:hypothetical protein